MRCDRETGFRFTGWRIDLSQVALKCEMPQRPIQYWFTVAATVMVLLIGAAILVTCCVLIGSGHERVGVVLTYEIDPQGSTSQTANLAAVAKQLNRRLGRDGQTRALDNKQLAVDIYGNPSVAELEQTKRLVGGMGYLEFRILADPAHPKDRAIIAMANLLRPNQMEVLQGNTQVAEWVAYSQPEFGPADKEEAGMVKRGTAVPQALVLMDPFNVTGEYLTTATKTREERGGPAIAFSLNSEGAMRFGRLTGQNLPNASNPGSVCRLGIILDKQLLSAPRIHAMISDRGIISGGCNDGSRGRFDRQYSTSRHVAVPDSAGG